MKSGKKFEVDPRYVYAIASIRGVIVSKLWKSYLRLPCIREISSRTTALK